MSKPMMVPSEQPWHLVVRVLSARNLGNEASRLKRSMAIRISLGSIVKETELVETVNGKAKWNSTFEFICNTRAVDSVLEMSLIRLTPVIHLRKKFAKALFACGAFPNNDQTEGWFPMANSNAEIKLCIFWTQNTEHCGATSATANATTPSSSSWSWRRKPNSTAMVSSSDLLFRKLPDKALLLRPHHRVEGEEADATEERCAMRPMLLVEVLQARNLIPVNRFTFNAASDPFALVTCHGTQHETEVVKSTLNPIWLRGRFEFGQVEDLDVEEDELRIKIRDWDRLGKNEDLGEVAIRLNQLSQLPFPAWFKLVPTIYMKPNQVDLGEVQLRIQLVAPHIAHPPLHVGASTPELLSPPPPPVSQLVHAEAELQVERPKLVVKIIQARNLLAMDFGGSSDPYCVVQCKSQTKRTSTVSHTLCPLWEFEHTFGEEDLIGLNDEVKINLFDNDSVISDLMDDKLGSVRVPMWSVFNADISQPLWYRVDPVPTSPQQCAGEIQLALSYTNPSATRQDIFNGKVWLLELQVSVMEYRGIKEVNKPHCIVALTSGSAKKTRKFRSKQATNLIWPPERFKFQGIGGGVVETDVLTVTMMERKLILGELSIDVAHMVDRVGYFDSQGKTFTSWFDMKPHQRQQNHTVDDDDDDDEEEEEEEDNMSGSGMFVDASKGDGDEEEELSTQSTMQSGKRSGRIRSTLSNALKHSPFKSPHVARESSVGSSYTENFLTQLAAHPPSIRLQIRLLPIGEKRSRVNKKLVVRVDQLTHAPSSIPPTVSQQHHQPILVYCRCKLGCHVRESSDVEFHANVLHGNPRFYANFYFKDEIDWLLHETEVRKADVERAARRQKSLTGEDYAGQASSAPTDQLVISILDSYTHHTLYETKTSFLDLGLLPNSATNVWSKAELPSNRQDEESVQANLHASFKLVNVKEEMIPLLGHIHMQLVQFKSVYVGFDVDSALRFVVRYSDGVFPSPLFVGDPCPVLTHASEPIRFPIYNMFNRITIEVYLTSTKQQGTIVGEIAPPAPLQLVFKKLRNAKNKVIDHDAPLPCKWGSLLGSCTLSLYDLYEMEAKTVFEEDCGSKPATEKAYKMPIMDGKQMRGTLYVEARCTENGGFAGLFAANPHPPVSPDGTKPFSLVNLRHETVRAVKVLNWLTAFSSHVNSLLDWESPKKTIGSILVILVLCCADWFAAHWFLVFPTAVLIHMMNRHRKRMNGQFESEFDLSSSNAAADSQGDGATSLSTHCRVAVISCNRKCQEHGPIQARLCVRDHPKADDVRVLGNTGMVPFETNSTLECLAPGILQADFSESKLGYTLKPSKLHRPNLQMWKYRDTLPAVPAFDFLMDNCTILENTLLVVYLVAGRDLLVRDCNGRSDPYVRFTLYDLVSKKDEKQRSATKLRTLNPMWNSRFVFGDGLKSINVASTLRVHVLDADNLRDEDMGSIEIELKDLEHWRTPQWAKLTPPKDQPPGSQAGEICLCIKWFTIQSHFQKDAATAARSNNIAEETADEASFVPQPLQGLLAGADPSIFPNGDRDERAVTSWTRCGSMFGIELVNRRHQVLGKALFPLGEFVRTDAKRLQPTVDLNVSIEGDFQVRLKVQLTLPDPRAEEIRAQMNEAKRADTLNPGKKYALVMNNLANAQQQLAMFNNQAERFKNLFNYTHPRRSDWMFNFLVFHAMLFILIPTRVYILLVVLFLFTEKFRPLGTMVMRFKHMLSVIPTDDDLRTVLQGPAYANKSKVFQVANRTPTHALNMHPAAAMLRGSNGSRRWNSAGTDTVVASRHSLLLNAASTASLRLRRRRFLHPGGDATANELQAITAADAAFSGSLSFSKLRHQTTTEATSNMYAMSMYERRFFIITTHGMHGWMDREVASLSNHPAVMHVLKIDNVTSELPQALLLSAKLQRQDCMFIVHTDLGEEYLFLASTPQKRENWVNALTHVLGGESEPSSSHHL